MRLANIHAVRNAPEGFAEWAIGAGAVDMESDEQWNAALAATDEKKQ